MSEIKKTLKYIAFGAALTCFTILIAPIGIPAMFCYYAGKLFFEGNTVDD